MGWSRNGEHGNAGMRTETWNAMGRVGVVGVGWDGTVRMGIVWTGWHNGHGRWEIGIG